MGNRPSHDLKLSVGDVVDGRYTLLELLGEGAAGKVFRAQDRGRNDMFVALKLLHAKDPRWENFFRREFEVLSKLSHPNLVRVYDFGPAPDENTFYFTQELVVGKPLLDVVAGKKVDEVAGLFIEICRALEFIHGHGVLHRDLKPANILVQKHADPGERVRVLDFGLWRELDPRPQKGARWAGTPPYLASEVLRGYGHSISADLYAVGVTLFQAVTRKLPHGRGTPQELLQARKEPAPDLTGVVAQPMAELICALLEEDPKQRPKSGAEVAARLSVMVPDHALAMPITLGRARLVGREREQEIVEGIISRVRSKDPQVPRVVVVNGPDGVGKTRFAGEIKAHTQLTGGRSAVGRCLEDVSWGYRPIADLVRALSSTAAAQSLSAQEREVVETLCPELAVNPRDLPAVQPPAEQARFQAAVVDLLLGFGKGEPCVLIVDDAPFCDPGSAQVLAALVQRLAGTSIVLVLTAGPEEEGEIPPAIIERAGSQVLRLRLAPLPRDEVRKLAAALLGTTDVPGHFVDSVMAHAGGNPLLVEEVVALFIEKGDLRRGEKGWLLDEFVSEDAAPGPGLNVLSERLGRLSEDEQCALCALAVFNRPAGAKILAAISGLAQEEVQAALSQAEAAGLLRVVGADDGRARVVFRHPQIRDALVRELREGGVLAEWHLNTAEVLEERAGKRAAAMAGTLAHHYAAAEDFEKAVEWNLKAAENALSTFAFDDAIGFCRRAIRVLAKAKVPATVGATTDAMLGKSLFMAGHISEARAFLEGAIAKAPVRDAPEAYGELHVWLARASILLGAHSAGQKAVDRALSALAEVDAPVAVARVLIARGELTVLEDPERARLDAEKALKLFRQSRRSVFDELACFTVLCRSTQASGALQKTAEYARHRVKLAEKHDLTLERIAALRDLADALSRTGERLEARNHLNTAHNLAREAGYRVEEALIIKALALQLYVSGAYSEAISRFQQAATLCAELGQLGARADALKFLGVCYTAKGDYDRAVDHLKAAMEAFDKTGQVAQIVDARTRLAEAYIAKGETARAQTLLKDAVDRLPAGTSLHQVHAGLYAVEGNLFSALGDFDRGRRAFLNAAARFRRSHDLYNLASALTGYAQLLLRFSKPSRALRLSKRAEWIFTELDAKGELKRIAPLINASEGLSGSRARARV